MTFRKGIPTKYNGVQFRSRIEAKWAAFFDRIGWKWEYEPIDLNGYIPDFALVFPQPILVEVKYELEETALEQHAAKVSESAPPYEALLVGARLFDHEWTGGTSLGLHGETHESGGLAWGSALLCLCPDGGIGVSNYDMLWGCRRCRAGHPAGGKTRPGDHLIIAERVADAWRVAGNAVQWRAPR